MEIASPLSRLSRASRTALDAVLDYALPPRCAGCGAIVGEQHGFCAGCWQEMRFLGEPCCASCGIPFELEEEEGARCGACLGEPPPWASARAALAYGKASSAVAIRLKYARRTGLAELMARHMLPRVHPDARSAGRDTLVIPVPLHRWRLWGRGFNQSLLVARHIARPLGLKVDPYILKRTKATRPLRDLASRERERTVANAFALDQRRGGAVRGKTILLVDDIHTSGATARACTRTLLAGGAEAVHLLCWARVIGDAA